MARLAIDEVDCRHVDNERVASRRTAPRSSTSRSTTAATAPPANTCEISSDAIRTANGSATTSSPEPSHPSARTPTPRTSPSSAAASEPATESIVAKPVQLRRLAADDIDDALAHHLSEAGQTVATRFITAIERALTYLARHPHSGSLRFAYELGIPELRSWPVPRFPYLVFYVDRDTHVDVCARPAHATRHPCGPRPHQWGVTPLGRLIERRSPGHRSSAGLLSIAVGRAEEHSSASAIPSSAPDRRGASVGHRQSKRPFVPSRKGLCVGSALAAGKDLHLRP